MHLKAHKNDKVMLQGRVFFFHYSLTTTTYNDQLSPNFHRFVILCIHVCWDAPSENTDL